MEVTRRLIASLGLAAAASTTLASPLQASDRRRESQALRLFAEVTHPDGAAAKLHPGWRRRADALYRDAANLGDAAYMMRALHLLAWFEDGHTGVYLLDVKTPIWALRLPFSRAVFFDGLYVTSAKDEALPLLGARITRVCGAPINDLARRFAEVFPAAGDPLKHRWSIQLLTSPGFLHGLGVLVGASDAPIALEGVKSDGSRVSAVVRPRSDAVADRTPVPRSPSVLELYAIKRFGSAGDAMEGGRNFVWADRDDGVIYVSLDRMDEDDFKRPFAEFDGELSLALKGPSATRLIVDLRRNGGGDNTLCEPLRKRIERSRFNRPGGLYVLIAPHTFSAAQNLANRLERETFAIFVGEPTGSSPNHCGDAKSFNQPGGGLPAQVSTVRWMDSSPQDQRRTIMPDLLTPTRFDDFLAGHDAALNAAVSHVDHRAFDDTLLTAPWQRPSQSVVWKPFWAL